VGTYAEQSTGIKNLLGPKRDVAAIAAILMQQLGVQPASSKTLLDEAATRDGILRTFTDHLITPSKRGDLVIFYFSGHGSQIYDETNQEQDGYNETIVPFDGRIQGKPAADILDDELHALIERLDAKGVATIVILDSCHSGTGTRSLARLKRVQRLTKSSPNLPKALRTQRVAIPTTHDMLLAASRDNEPAYESGDSTDAHGEFTAALVSALKEGVAGASYRDLVSRVSIKLRAAGIDQSPQAEGDDRDLQAFSKPGKRGRVATQFSRKPDGSYEQRAGSLVGVTVGSDYAVYPTALKAATGNSEPIGRLKVSDVTPEKSTLKSSTPLDQSSLYGIEVAHRFDSLPPTIRVLEDPRGTLADLIKAVPDQLWTLKSSGTADYYARSSAGIVTFFRADESEMGQLAADNELPSNLATLARHIHKYRDVFGLTRSDAAMKLEIEAFALDTDGTRLRRLDRTSGRFIANVNDRIVFCLRNRASTSALYFHLLALNDSLYPTVLPITPLVGSTPSPVKRNSSFQTQVVRAQVAGVDVIRLMATTTAIPVEILGLSPHDRQLSREASRDPLHEILARYMMGVRSDAVAPMTAWVTEDILLETRPGAAAPRAVGTCM